MSYVIRNCPCYALKGGYYDCWANQDTWCENITDCVIKQVIDKCKYYQNKIGRTPQYRAGFVDATKDILQLFDIEEMNK